MSHALYLVGDVFDVLATIPDGSIDAVITRPPYFNLRSYIPADHPDKHLEIGQERTPGAYIESLLSLMDQLWPKLTDDGTYWINLGDSHAGSGGSGGDYNEGGLREGQAKWMGTARSAKEAAAKIPWRGQRPGYPLDQSVCWLPELFGASLAYGRNLLTGQEHRQWITRPPVTWCKPNPSVGELTRKFRTATELWIYGGKHQQHYFDLDAVREAPTSDEQWTTTKTDDAHAEMVGRRQRSDEVAAHQGKSDRKTVRAVNPNGVPPKNWWVVATEPYPGAHFAVFPPSLVVRPVKAGCPIGGTILDPFAGSGTALAVATGHGRDAIGIDLDHRNADLALDRVGPLMLTVEHPSLDGAALATTPSIVRVSQKRCTKCHLMKPLTEFSPNRHKRDGRQSWCKDCYREQLRRRRAENPALRLRDYNQARAYDQAMRRLRQRHEAEFRSLYDEELGRANSSGDGAA